VKKLLSILMISALLVNPILATDNSNINTELNINISDIENSINLLKQELQENNLKEELKDLKDLVTFLALKHIESEQVKSEEKSTINISVEEQNKAIKILKTTFSKIFSAGNFVLDKADKIISKKTFLALCLLLGPAAYFAPKLVGPIIKCIGKVFAKGGLIIGAKAASGFKEAVMENPDLATEIIKVDLAIKGTTETTNKVAKDIIGAGVVGAIKLWKTSLISNPVTAALSVVFAFLPVGPSLLKLF
jgi:hypothetical protein